jgi:hypothetical protein
MQRSISPSSPSRSLPRAAAPALVALAVLGALLAPLGASAKSARHAGHQACVARAGKARKASTARSARHGGGRVACARRRPAPRAALTATPVGVGAPPALGALGAGVEASTAKPRVPPKPKPTPPAPVGEPSGPGPGNLPAESGETVTDPIDARFLTDVNFGKRSFWLQPWRAYLDTWPASRLTESLGINFPTNPGLAENTAQLLQDSGFKLARMAISWGALSYEAPETIQPLHVASITARLTAMRKHGLRPLIMLDANSLAPTPEIGTKLETLAEARAGAQTVLLSPASAAKVVPGHTGFDNLTWEGAADVLITKVSPGGLATLSRPLRTALPAGVHSGATLRFAPFASPKLASGAPNPVFAETMAGWLAYVGAVNRIATSVMGAGNYDLEIWNELTFGSQFLNSENYYSTGTLEAGAEPEPSLGLTPAEAGTEAEEDAIAESSATLPGSSETETESESSITSALENLTGTTPPVLPPEMVGKSAKKIHTKEVIKAIRRETVAYVRNPANGISPAVGITDGFASTTPFPSGAAAPLGMTALSKHPYVGAKQFPADFRKGHLRPIDALGGRDTSSNSSYEPLFVPNFQADYPEATLNVVSTETTVRDIAPLTTEIYGFPHGREVAPAGGAPLQKWITEYNLSSHGGHTVGPDGVTPESGPAGTLTAQDKMHFQAKVALRSLVADVSKGFSREYFFKAAPGFMSLIGEGFFTAAEAHPESYPGDQLGGETMDGLRNLLGRFQGPGPSGAARQLELVSIAQNGNHAQFAGDGTASHPPLYDRDALAVFPFQASPTRFVIPVYVMTRDLRTLYQPGAPTGDVHRFDLPDETFRITLSNLPETAAAPSVSAYDPLRGQSSSATLVSRSGSTATFEVAATDYPRLLSLDYSGT